MSIGKKGLQVMDLGPVILAGFFILMIALWHSGFSVIFNAKSDSHSTAIVATTPNVHVNNVAVPAVESVAVVAETKATPTPAQIAQRFKDKFASSNNVLVTATLDIYHLLRETSIPKTLERIGSLEFVKNHRDKNDHLDAIHISLFITSWMTEDTFITNIEKVNSRVHLYWALKKDPVTGPFFVESATDDKGRPVVSAEYPPSSPGGVENLKYSSNMYLWDEAWNKVLFSKCDSFMFTETLIGPNSANASSFAELFAESKLIGTEICHRSGPYFGKTLYVLSRVVGDEKKEGSWSYCAQTYWIDSESYMLVAWRTEDSSSVQNEVAGKISDYNFLNYVFNSQ